MKILLLGANSYVGSRIYLELYKHYEVIGTFHKNKLYDKFVPLDITDKQAALNLITTEKPNVIIHSANNGSRKWCDEHPEAATKLNQEATNYVAEAANNIGAKLIYISSFAAINPYDLYGRLKQASEQISKTTKAGYVILQPGIVIGFSPKVKKEDGFFSSVMENIDEGKPAEYDATNPYQPTSLAQFCEVIKIILEKNIWNQTFPVAAPDLKTKYELAKDILGPFNITVKGIESGKPVAIKKQQDLSELKNLDLPVYSYQQTIKKTVQEIENRAQFIIQPI